MAIENPDPEALLVRREIMVDADPATAFRVFTSRIGRWWPLASHHIGVKPAESAIIEPFVGGRWYERAMDGTECDWGRVLAWAPPDRLLLTWEISCQWAHDSRVRTEVEVLFVAADDGGTRVLLEHRKLDQYGSDAARMRDLYSTDNAWTGILRHFAAGLAAGDRDA